MHQPEGLAVYLTLGLVGFRNLEDNAVEYDQVA